MGGQDGTSGTVTRGREGLVMRGLKEMKVMETYESRVSGNLTKTTQNTTAFGCPVKQILMRHSTTSSQLHKALTFFNDMGS